MRLALRIIVIGSVAATGALAAQASRTVWDGVYTDAQAKRGEAIYRDHCIRCHGEMLTGGTDGAGPLVGPTFNGNWNGVNLGDMIERVRTSMPQDKPGTLSRQQHVDVLAYILSFNKFPAGPKELARQTEILNQIQFKATKP